MQERKKKLRAMREFLGGGMLDPMSETYRMGLSFMVSSADRGLASLNDDDVQVALEEIAMQRFLMLPWEKKVELLQESRDWAVEKLDDIGGPDRGLLQ